MEYKRMIAREKLANVERAIQHYPQPQMFTDTLTGMKLYGGYRITAHPGAGNPHYGPTTLYTSDGANSTLQAGSLSKELSKIGKQASKVAKETSRALQKAVPGAATKLIQDSVITPLGKYGEKALTEYLTPSNVAALGESVAETSVGMGRAKGRPRKNKQHDFGGASSGGSFKSVMKTVSKGANKVIKKVAPLVQKYATEAAMDYLAPGAEGAAEFVAANPEVLLLAAGRKGKKGGALFGLTKKKLAAPIDKLHGGKRKARYAKGSPEAIEWGRKMAAARKKK